MGNPKPEPKRDDELIDGIPWKKILQIIGEILIIIAKMPLAAACAQVGPKFGISAALAQKLFNKYRDEVE